MCVGRHSVPIRFAYAVIVIVASSTAHAEWKSHDIRVLDGAKAPIHAPSRLQIVTESWNRVVAVPYIIYMPEKDRVLMLASCDYPHQAVVLWSDDRGATWSSTKFLHTNADGKPDTGMGVGLTYLGGGKVLATSDRRWASKDFGETWTDYAPLPPLPDGKTWNTWDPMFVDRDSPAGAVKRLVETGYSMDTARWESAAGPGYSRGHIRHSADEGLTWNPGQPVPQWDGVSEVTMVRAANGDLVAACRTDKPARIKDVLDHYEGLAVSISTDDGKTWSALNRLYDWGRHHPSLARMPDGTLVMTYVVRKGYTDSAEGLPRFGIEAIVSRDHGRSWDLDHRYVLHWWTGNRTGANGWWASCQATSTVLLPDGGLLTAFGTGYRSQPNEQNLPAPRDVGLVSWRLYEKELGAASEVSTAPPDSERRNVFDPTVLTP